MNLRKQLVALPLAVALAGMTALPAAADHGHPNQAGGAVGLVAAVVQVDRSLNDLLDVNLEDVNIEVITVKDSLNNVLQNARFLNNITVLQDFLNDADIDVTIQDVLQDFLNENNILITDVVAIDVLSGGDIVIFVRE